MAVYTQEAVKELTESSVADRMKVSEWLSTVLLNETAHKALITLGSYLLGTNAVTGIGASAQSGIQSVVVSSVNVIDSFLSTPTFTNQSAGLLSKANELLDVMKDPNIEGIPIHATQEQEITDVDVSKNIIISEVAANKREVLDNAVPRLRQWNLRGHLVANPFTNDMDRALIIKPGLVAQRSILQLYADSRRPVWYKTHDNRFFKVLITHFATGYNTNYRNGLDVEIGLTEFKTLNVGRSRIPLQSMTEVTNEEV